MGSTLLGKNLLPSEKGSKRKEFAFPTTGVNFFCIEYIVFEVWSAGEQMEISKLSVL